MSNSSTRYRYSSVSRPQVIKNNERYNYNRSPSVSRLGATGAYKNIYNSSNNESVNTRTNYRPSYISANSNGATNSPHTSTYSINMRKTGSCQNLVNTDNHNYHLSNGGSSTLRNRNEPQPSFQFNNRVNTKAYGSNVSATNNSYSTNTLGKSSFYNGYSNNDNKSGVINASYKYKDLKSKPPSSYYSPQGFITASSSSNKFNPDGHNVSHESSSESTENDSYKSKMNGHITNSNGPSTKQAQSSTASNSTNTPSSSNHYSISSLETDYQRKNSISNNKSNIKNGFHNKSNDNYFSNVNSDTTKSLNNSYSTRGLVGLVNLGNTCFMSSVIQCLSNCRILNEYCMGSSVYDDINPNSKTRGALIKSFVELIRSLWKAETSYISPDKFKRNFQKITPSFHGHAQQDSQEFLRLMLEALHQDVNRVKERPKPLKINEEEDERLSEIKLAEVYWSRYLRIDDSFIVDLFVGQLKSTLSCKRCGYKSITYDPFWDLSLPIPKSHHNNTLNQCLDLFTSEEVLDGDEMPKCARCKQKRPCTKSFSIQKFPPILVIHLKRFAGDRYRSKINAFIEFPIANLDFFNYTANTCQQRNVTYNLIGISNHSGTVHGGHYTAYCCNPYSNTWHEFNDTHVQRVSPSAICSAEAYVLFYQRM